MEFTMAAAMRPVRSTWEPYSGSGSFRAWRTSVAKLFRVQPAGTSTMTMQILLCHRILLEPILDITMDQARVFRTAQGRSSTKARQ